MLPVWIHSTVLDLPQDLTNTKEQVIFTTLNQDFFVALNSANLLGMHMYQRCPVIKKTECNRIRWGEVSTKKRLKKRRIAFESAIWNYEVSTCFLHLWTREIISLTTKNPSENSPREFWLFEMVLVYQIPRDMNPTASYATISRIQSV